MNNCNNQFHEYLMGGVIVGSKDKLEWLSKKQYDSVELLLKSAERKKDLAEPNAILIDDREDNVMGWIERGGIGILHITTKHTIQQLKDIL